ncbi:MAG: hypothetical protein KFF73_14610 [Cyclobacteriaceae bacterium]|nr:hypothetical protein [Cyclobacteriaceae bacterium]
MRLRFISFIVFQVVAWTLYFNWESPSSQKTAATEKHLEIAEISPRTVNNNFAFENNYKLILRNDGFFIRINQDQTRQSGLWKIDHELPALLLTSPKGDHHYQIITSLNDKMHVREIDTNEEFARNSMTESDNLNRLFSSTALEP